MTTRQIKFSKAVPPNIYDSNSAPSCNIQNESSQSQSNSTVVVKSGGPSKLVTIITKYPFTFAAILVTCISVLCAAIVCIVILTRNSPIDESSLMNVTEELLSSNITPTEITTTTTERKLTKWKWNATTVAGGNGSGEELNELAYPSGIFIDQNNDIFIADFKNHRIVRWKLDKNEGVVVAGGNGKGNGTNQLNEPSYVIVDQYNNSLIICDSGNKRVVRWFSGTLHKTIIQNVDCFGLAVDKYGYLYVPNLRKSEVRRWKIAEEIGEEGVVVAGGHGYGDNLNQFKSPGFVFVDDEQAVYVTDQQTHRVMKWRKGVDEGIVVVGGDNWGNDLDQLARPMGIIVDRFGQIYVADEGNNRIVRWSEGSRQGEIIVGGNGSGTESNQFAYSKDLAFDTEGNLYVADVGNNRIQRFDLI
ncbi:unnamed protein product [Adineta ricciae]|uniref:Uncharacterized protein n=1 Tax=Adineta ricciae TaxID=249248 RepID=A0A814XD07_ADIRI|nr:unnamed protein product [Adineta ricciae]CAF1216196.1 unnamed protein product [Adineta ricciae]